MRGFIARRKARFRFLKPLWSGYRSALGALPWRWLPVSSRVFGPPKGWHARVADYLASPLADSRDRTQEVWPAERIERVPPRSLETETHWKYLEARTEAIPPVGVHVLHGVRFWGDYAGTLIGRDDRVLGDLTRDVWEVRRHKIFTRWRLPRCRQLSGTVAILTVAQAETNYWHWTLELLPRLEILRRAGFPPEAIDWFVVNHRDLPFQCETLAALGVPWEKVVRADGALHLECERAVTTTLKPGHLSVTRPTCDFLNAQAASRSPEARPWRRLYVSRQGASFRRVTNEEQIVAELAGRGFETVTCESLTVAEQRRLFREAAVIVGPHGGGLTNLVYAQPGTKVLELLPPAYIDLSYSCFTGLVGLEHWIAIGEGPRPPHGVDPMARQDDITVNLETLCRTLDAMGVTRSAGEGNVPVTG